MSALEQLKEVSGLELFRHKHNTMVAIELSNGNTCLYNPIDKGQKACDAIKKISHIVSPNHYHNKRLAEFHKSYAKAVVCASTKAKPRLAEITGLKIGALTTLKKQLPTGMEILEPAGLKTGEIWLRFSYGKKCGWIVGDAFCGSKTSIKETKTPQLLGPFPSYGVEDKEKYKSWVLKRIEADKPTLIIPCHGGVIRDTALPKKIDALLAKL